MSNPGSLSRHVKQSTGPVVPRSDAPDSAVSSPPLAREPKIPWLTDLIVRHRRWLFALSLLFFVLTFNGRWRIGADSSTYRGLARAIARGEGYQFGEFGSHHAYPGLPYLLAGVNKLAGENVFRPALAQFIIVILALLTIWVTYQLVLLHYPQWMAVSVACGLAINSRFLEVANGLVTDVPFLLGVMTSLYGWDLLRAATTSRSRTRAILLLTIGLLLAAVMRPTFWVLGLAWLCACVWGLITGPRKFYATALVILLCVWLVFGLLDPRTKGFAPLGGGYEREAISIITESSSLETDARVKSLAARVSDETRMLFGVHFPAAIFGQVLPVPIATVFSVLLIGSSLLLLRRHPIWALVVLFTVGVTIVLSTAPRYYVMILPFVLLGGLLLITRLTDRIPGGWGDLLLLLWLGFLTGENISRNVALIASQHAAPLAASPEEFYAKYRDGRLLPTIRLANLINQRVAPGDKVIAPSAPVVRYLSDRNVIVERDLLPLRRSPRHYPEHLAGQNIRYVVMPASEYREKDPEISRLIRLRVIYPTKRVARVDGMTLSRAGIYVPPGDWREGINIPPEKKAIKPAKKPAKIKNATTKPTKKKKPSATTRPKKKIRKPATTRPSTPSAVRTDSPFRIVPARLDQTASASRVSISYPLRSSCR